MPDCTSSNQNTVDGSVADRCLTGLDVHERLVSNAHEHSLLHADLWKTEHHVHGWEGTIWTWTIKADAISNKLKWQ